jgi:Lon protease-like protein
MFELPLFPLNAVLYPGTPLHLHIFELRYQRMINLCIDERRPFGVVLIRHGQEALGPLAEPYSIGCTAKIVHLQRLEEGRLNLVAVGQERFIVRSLDTVSAPYLTGNVELFPLEAAATDLAQAGERLRQRVERFLRTLQRAGGTQDPYVLPTQPVDLAYLAGALLEITPVQKQALLEINQPEKLLAEVQLMYAREQGLLNAMIAHGRDRGATFSYN